MNLYSPCSCSTKRKLFLSPAQEGPTRMTTMEMYWLVLGHPLCSVQVPSALRTSPETESERHFSYCTSLGEEYILPWPSMLLKVKVSVHFCFTVFLCIIGYNYPSTYPAPTPIYTCTHACPASGLTDTGLKIKARRFP